MIDNSYVLCCDTAADLTLSYLTARNINYLPYRYNLGDQVCLDDLVSITPDKFFKTMEDGAMTKTSQPNSDDFVNFLTPFLEKGLDVVHVCLSSGLSGVLLSANIAKEVLEEKYPDRKVYIIDSLAASRGLGLLVDKLADLRDEGYSAEQLVEWAEENKLNLHHWFYTTDLTYFVRGGRVSKASGWFGSLLNICPLLHVDEEGHLIPVKKCRGKNAVMKAMLDTMAENVLDGLEYAEKCFISHAAREEEAKQVAAEIEKTYPHLDGKVQIESIGPIIGCHTGPGTVALFFWGKSRKK